MPNGSSIPPHLQNAGLPPNKVIEKGPTRVLCIADVRGIYTPAAANASLYLFAQQGS